MITMKRQKLHKAERWDDYDPQELAERLLAKTKNNSVKRLRKDCDDVGGGKKQQFTTRE